MDVFLFRIQNLFEKDGGNIETYSRQKHISKALKFMFTAKLQYLILENINKIN